jgi:hypothetical protein
MKLSQDRRQALYNAIAEPITALRVSLCRSNRGDEMLDRELFALEQEIDRRQEAVLRDGGECGSCGRREERDE